MKRRIFYFMVLEVNNVSKAYANVRALDDVSISVDKGEIFGLLGPNGAGKSTLIRIITQIINADSGEIKIKGQSLEADHIKDIGYLPEERGLYKKMKVGEQLMYLARLKGMEKSEAFEALRYWVKRFEIQDWWEKKIEDLSKGMQQKVQFISTVVHSPDLLILDEPFSGFDPINANLIRDEILELRDKGCSIIFSTHRMESVEELCDHIALINKSKKILDGKKKDIKDAYRSFTYEVMIQGELKSLSADYEVLEERKTEYGTQISLKDKTESSPNTLIQSLSKSAEIISFKEQIPSMNDIFISKVKEGESHE